MSQKEQPAIKFPCTFPIKAMGLSGHDIQALAAEIVTRHYPELEPNNITSRASHGNKYISITLTITATSRKQLDAIYHELSACEQIIMAL